MSSSAPPRLTGSSSGLALKTRTIFVVTVSTRNYLLNHSAGFNVSPSDSFSFYCLERSSLFPSSFLYLSLSVSRCLVAKAKVTTTLPVVDGSRGSVRLRRETLINRVKSLEIDGRCTRPARRDKRRTCPQV